MRYCTGTWQRTRSQLLDFQTSPQYQMILTISFIALRLAYPNLANAITTKKRRDLRSFWDDVIFVNHRHHEQRFRSETDGVPMVVENIFEASMATMTLQYPC